MNNLEDREVIVLAAHCEECGTELDGVFDDGAPTPPYTTAIVSAIEARIRRAVDFPTRVMAADLRNDFHCAKCGGRIVFDVMGAGE